MENRQTVLITGATSGIGLSIAIRLYSEGFKVFGTSRFPERYAGKFPFELLELDVSSQESVDSCFGQLFSCIQVLDVLISNAGGMGMRSGNVEETTIWQAQQQLDTNFWGAVRVTKAVLPYMRKQRQGKIIATGSVVGLFGVPFSSYYSTSKHAMEGFFKSLRFEISKFNIHVSVLQPGFFNTNIGHSMQYIPTTIRDYVETQENMNTFLKDSLAKSPAPEPVADAVLKIINSKTPRYNYPVGSGSRFLPFLQFISYRLFEKGFKKNAKL
ncbi:MAG TPA: SDR family NAD(P)-dependent oxidoreductase [Mucilaginibacter sp.]|jgi:NAD(P)-dependent dehydrogenase (short-subunit alcohol dehydrogenase family)